MSTHFQYNGPINRNPGPNEVGIIVYGYWPSLAFAWIGVITFTIVGLVQTYQAWKWSGKYRTFHVLMAIGCSSEVGGYATRLFSHYKPFNLAAFIASFSMIFIAPVYFCAAIDFTLNIIADGFEGSRRILLMSPRNVLIVFITTDVISVTVQAVGASLVGYTTSSFFYKRPTFIQYDQANNTLIAGLALQIVAWVIFLAFVLVAIYRAYTIPNLRAGTYRSMRWMLWVIFGTATLLLLRSCYRLAEAVLGYLSGAATNEPMLACLEYLPVALTLIAWSAFPPWWFVNKGQTLALDNDDRRPGTYIAGPEANRVKHDV